MKLLLLLSLLLTNPQWNAEVSVFMKKGGCGRAQQGLESYGNYIFSLEDGGHVNVYDWKNAASEPVGGFELASSRPDNHANNAEFGIEKKKGAGFPLMYVTNGKVGSDIEWYCFVESISKSRDGWKSELVQTIVLDGCNGWKERGYTEIFGAPSWLVDREDKALWVFSAIKRTTFKFTRTREENLYVATKFRIPKLREGSRVVLKAEDILDQVTFPFDAWFTQAGCMKDGKIYYCFGVGKSDWDRPSEIRVYDTRTRKISASYSLQNEIPYEMEDIFIRDGWMYVNTNTSPRSGAAPCIFKVSLPKDNTASACPRDWLAHRGLHLRSTVAGENSLEAIGLAKRAGFKYIETDCRWTSDKVMVIMHDAAINRTCTLADGTSLGKKPVNVEDLTFEQLRRDYRLKADLPQRRSVVPTLEEYLKKCKGEGFSTVLIEPKLNDPTGEFYKDIVRIADKAVGRGGYLIVSNNYANEVMRRDKWFKGIPLMGILYQTDWKTMAGLGNTLFAISSTRFTPDLFREHFTRAKSEGRTVESSCGVFSRNPQTYFDTYQLLLTYGRDISIIATDINTPDYRGQGKVVAEFTAESQDEISGKLSALPSSELYGIYLDLEFDGKATVKVGPDTFTIDSAKGRSAKYSRTVCNCSPRISISPLEGFKMSGCHIRIVEM